MSRGDFGILFGFLLHVLKDGNRLVELDGVFILGVSGCIYGEWEWDWDWGFWRFFWTGILTHGLSNGYAGRASRLPGCHSILLLSAFTYRVIVVLSWDGLGTTG